MNRPGKQTDKIRCLLIDDEASATDYLEEKLLQTDHFTVVAKVNDPDQALVTILKYKPDLLFLDIQMPGKSGFDIVEEISKTTIRPFIIFVTAFDRFAIQAIRASAFDFLLKPVSDEDLLKATERFLARFRALRKEDDYSAFIDQSRVKKIRFNNAGGFSMIDPRDIIYVEADWNYSDIHFGNGKSETVTMNLGAIEEILPKGCFARINRSVIINLSYLDKVKRGKRLCILKKDEKIYEFVIPLLRIKQLENSLIEYH